MASATASDLARLPQTHHTSRRLFDVVVSDDNALPIIEAGCYGDVDKLQSLLSQPNWAKIAFEEQSYIYYEERPSRDTDDLREVSAMPVQNIERAIIQAAVYDQAASVSTLLNFAIGQGVDPHSIISYYAIEYSIRLGRAEVMRAMVMADPKVVDFHMHHGIFVLDRAVKSLQTSVVAVLLQHGADPSPDANENRSGRGYPSSLLAIAAGTNSLDMVRLLLEHGAPPARSGALHGAAERGRLDIMRLLIEHGANVNEQLTANGLPWYHYDHCVGRTPMHMAAASEYLNASDKEETVKLLESKGARNDIRDSGGKTSAQLLEDLQAQDEGT